MDRPALQRLLKEIEEGKVDTIVVYKVDRLTSSLADFAKIVEALDARGVSFASVTQQFNTTTSMGRLTLNVLLSFAQFEREVTGERIRDKIAASKQKGMWMGGRVPVGYDVKERKLIVNPEEADLVRRLFHLYLELGPVLKLKAQLDREAIMSKERTSPAVWAAGLVAEFCGVADFPSGESDATHDKKGGDTKKAHSGLRHSEKDT
jgi:site-specific DNA recombinase